MISSINFSFKAFFIFLICFPLLLVTAAIKNPGVSAQDIPVPLEFKFLTSDKSPPQAAMTTTIRWTAKASGGVGSYSYEFRTRKGTEENVVYSGPSPEWNWSPLKEGIYRVKVVVRDRAGNEVESGWSANYEILPELLLKEAVPDRPAPQTAVMTIIRWTARATGGVDPYTYEFHMLKDSEDITMQTGPSPSWDWTPIKEGIYSVKVVVRDTLDNTVESGWSSSYEIVPELLLQEAAPDRTAPQAAVMTTIRWTSRVTGGVGAHTYEFHTLKDSEDKTVQTGASPYWDWMPLQEGIYQIRVIVRDILGNTVDSSWSPEYEIVPELLVEALPNRPPPQIIMTPIRWITRATGGVGAHTFEFHTFKDSEDTTEQTGPSPYWDWMPMEAGYHRIKVIVRDTLGNTVDNGWSSYYEIVPELQVNLLPDRLAPQAAVMTTIRWNARIAGGVRDQTFEFHLIKDSEDEIVQKGPLPYWNWTPIETGVYKVKVVVSDRLGNIVDSDWSTEYEIVSQLLIEEVVFDRPPPQSAVMNTIRWSTDAAGGVGDLSYEFHILKESEEKTLQTGPSPEWDWTPMEAGIYRIKAVALDKLGNRTETAWSPEYEIRPNLIVELSPDRVPPQAAMITTIRWNARAAGGVGEYSYEFRTLKDSEEKTVQTGPSPYWDWKPMDAGYYSIKVIVRDTLDNSIDSGWSSEYQVEPELLVEQPVYDKSPPQAAVMTTILWTAKATGGVGEYTYEFHTLRDSADIIEQTGSSSEWVWTPIRAGLYRLKVVVRDRLGNTVDSGWSSEYQVEPQLLVELPVPDRMSPQAAVMSKIWWSVKAMGGVGAHTYEFRFDRDSSPGFALTIKDKRQKTKENGPSTDRKKPPTALLLSDNKKGKVMQTGSSPEWIWAPQEVGHYRVKVIVRDTLNNTVDSGWSADFEINTFNEIYSPIAVLPVSNISRASAPLDKTRLLLTDLLLKEGLQVVENDSLESFLERYRIRYTRGLDRTRAREFREENIAGAVLITTLEHFDERYPPKIALVSRLVSTRDKPEILWMESVGLAGDDSPEILGLGLIKDPGELLNKTIQHLSDSFSSFLKGKRISVHKKDGLMRDTRFEPKAYNRASDSIDRARGYTVAVLPFFNRSERAYAGEIMGLHFVNEMGKVVNFQLIEPGVIRDALLKLRVIMYDGISLDTATALLSMLNVDFILTGTVMDYKDYTGPVGKPQMDFSILLLDRRNREAVWTSKSYNEGDDDVYFFDFGKVNTSNAMASEMVRSVVKKMIAK